VKLLKFVQGFVYVLDCEGRTLEGWPLQMGEVQAQVAVGDINGDGALEVVAVDNRGNVAALSPDGTELWERHVKSNIAQVVPSLSCTFPFAHANSLQEGSASGDMRSSGHFLQELKGDSSWPSLLPTNIDMRKMTMKWFHE